MNTNTKYWSFTWDTNVKQKKLPDKRKLINFLNNFSSSFAFQTEIGTIKGKEHYQGMFTLLGPRMSKAQTLNSFKESFKILDGLTLQPVFDKVALEKYVTKTEGRVDGPYYGGKNEKYDEQMAKSELRPWQEELFDLITGDEQQNLRDRKVIFIQDESGNTGKSWFQKWLRTGQKQIIARSLPVSNVDRLISAINIITKDTEIGVLNVDLTRTKGDDQSYEDLFSAIEQIKNGYVVDVMYGKFNEAIFKPPIIIVYTNEKIASFRHYLSDDRWQVYRISDKKLIRHILSGQNTYLKKDPRN